MTPLPDAATQPIAAALAAGRRVLVCGKGPTFRAELLADASYFSIALNHACLQGRSDLALFVDFEAFEECRPAGCVALPWFPNRRLRISLASLADLYSSSPVLRAACDASRLYAYHRRQCRGRPPGHLPAVDANYFSAEAAFGLALAAGAKEIFSVGVDGGKEYAACFDPKDRLRNGRQSFEVQMPAIRQRVAKAGAVWTLL